MIQSFWQDETGAVSVDWVVLTAATVGLGLSAAAAVRTGTSSLGGQIEAGLSNAGVVALRWLSATEIVSQNFGDGNFDGWNAIKTISFGPWGTALGPFGSEVRNNPLTFDVNLSAGASNALIEFELIVGDSWDGLGGPNNSVAPPEGDRVVFQVNGRTISAEAFVHAQNHAGYAPALFQERSTSIEIDGTTYNLNLRPIDLPTRSVGGAGQYEDQRWHVSLEAVGAQQNFTLGYSTTSRQAADNESFSISNFSVREN
jgi:hypothetical protein